ncbi:endo alpha-1,4 polygalactosaminidase [Chitinolyticbacter meiyuanensis]|uniref:endo alpha-1,4 polygalactosaminidase n=1 Tax=Chitinolyticbacter meiyuanensis TaxID=682798 RepID=UPI0011E5AD78|nr:endo alpha-1,4 polygalactosaminidase [Chitinolyticbacter meiyuanensis]
MLFCMLLATIDRLDQQADERRCKKRWAKTEDCAHYGWCADLKPYTDAGKAVFMAEYTDLTGDTSQFCPQAKQLKFSGVLKRRNLDAWRVACP